MAVDTISLDDAFAALAAFDWGADAAPLVRIDAAVVACHGDAAQTAALEKRLGAIVSGSASRAASSRAVPAPTPSACPQPTLRLPSPNAARQSGSRPARR